jgi:alanine racemase
LRSLANSAGVLCWPAARRDCARRGIALYGADPRGAQASDEALRPVMKVRSEVFAVREVAAGEPIGYGARFVAERATRVGLVAFGYADGYPRTAANGTPVGIDKRSAPLVGRVSMDMLTVDLTELPDAGIGGDVELWGDRIPVGVVAASTELRHSRDGATAAAGRLRGRGFPAPDRMHFTATNPLVSSDRVSGHVQPLSLNL